MSNVVARFTVQPQRTIETEFKINAVNQDHNKLYNRDLADQHPISAITGLEDAISSKQDILTAGDNIQIENGIISATDTTYTAGTGISIENGVISNTQNSAEWGNITGDITDQTDLQTALAGKQASLTPTQIEAVNSGANTTNIGQIATNTSDITAINNKIPAQASSSNQLADKNFVNSSISTNTANFIGTFNSVAELEAYSGTLTNNDYAFVISTDTAGNTVYNRYKYTTATTPPSWLFEYALNNSSFTANQWEAINSGATTTNIGQIATNTSTISGHIANKNNPHEVTKTQVGLGNVDNTSDLNKPISTATQTALNAKQDTISDLATIRSGASAGATAVQPATLVTELAKKQDILTAGTDLEIITISSLLPAEYTQLEYIEGANNYAYINTGIIPTSSMEYYLKTQFVSITADSSATYFAGARNTNATGYGMFLMSTATQCGRDFFGGENGNYWADSARVAGDIFEFHIENAFLTITKNDSIVGTHQYTPTDTVTCNLYLNSLNANNSIYDQQQSTNRIYRFTIAGVADMIPAKRNSDNAIGMYDIVRNQFFASAGAGSFTPGSEITEETVINFTNTTGYITSSALSGYQTTSNLVTSVSSASTDSQYPSAKLFYDTCGDIETLINAL